MFTENYDTLEKTLILSHQLDERGYKALKPVLSKQGHYEEIDMSHVTNIDSSGIALLIKLYRNNARDGRLIRLTNIKPRVRAFLELTRVSNLFEISEAPALNIGMAA